MESFQKNLLEALKSGTPVELNLAKELMDLLQYDKSSVYKRLSGKVPFNIDDALACIRYYRLSADALIHNQSDTLIFQYPALEAQNANPAGYINHLSARFEQVLRLPAVNIWYTTYEIPVFYYMFFPELIGFKLFQWNRINWHAPAAEVYEPTAFMAGYPGLEHACKQLALMYTRVPTREFWPLHVLDHTLSQIRSCHHAGLLASPEVGAILCSRLREMIRLIDRFADTGIKETDGTKTYAAPIELYFNEVAYTNNTILVRSHDQPAAVYAALDNPNFILNTQPTVLQQMTNWMESIRSKTIRISEEGERYRRFFIQTLEKRLSELEIEMGLVM
jgi:hypothetical protein